MLTASEFLSGTWTNVIGNENIWQSNQNSSNKGYAIKLGYNVTYEGESYEEWGSVILDSNENDQYDNK